MSLESMYYGYGDSDDPIYATELAATMEEIADLVESRPLPGRAEKRIGVTADTTTLAVLLRRYAVLIRLENQLETEL